MTDRNHFNTWLPRVIDKVQQVKPYKLFEQLIANILVLLISFIVVVALYKLGEDVVSLL